MGEINGHLKSRSRTGSQLVVSPLPSWQKAKTGEFSAPGKLLFLCLRVKTLR